jgi:hypothetical protein
LAKVGIVALLAAMLAIPAALYVIPVVQATPDRSAWLKIVTEAWKGVDYPGPPWTLAQPHPTLRGFADRYNVTNVCVEVYRLKSGGAFDRAPGSPFYPNATGFVRITWPDAWENVTVVVKAKSYQGECITDGSPFSGLIVYWLTVSPTQGFLNSFAPGAGLTTISNATFNDDGELDTWTSHIQMQTAVGSTSGLRSGPVDILGRITPKDFAGNYSSPTNAWVARASYIFKVFHEHTWYGTDDVLTYAIIFIYDVDHTPPNSEKSLLQAAITGSDGQSRYTKDIYPARHGLGGGRYAENRLVPIPLQAIKLNTRQVFWGGIPAPSASGPGAKIKAPHLNATTRVWWETVLVNQTFYVGREYNGSDTYTTIAGKNRPGFGGFAGDPTIRAVTQGGITGIPAGPLSIVLNHTVPNAAGVWPAARGTPKVADFQNNTVFYARFCVQDADLRIQHPEVGDKLVDAEVTINLKKKPDTPYYLSHNILTTDSGGCTDDPHKWPGYRSDFSKFARFPNGTNWGLRGSLNVSKAFDPKDDQGPAWSPGGYFERAWGGDWTGPYVNAGKNYSALIPVIKYMKTRTLADDPDYDGFDVQVKWKGGSRNNYGGTAVLVDSIRVRNPYAIALLYNYGTDALFGQWVFPYTVLANNKLWLQIHAAQRIVINHILGTTTITDPDPTKLEVMGRYTLVLENFDSTTGRFTLRIWPIGIVAVNNANDGVGDVDYWLDFGGSIVIENALVSFKKHDVMAVYLGFEAGQGQADRGVDGSDDYTTVDFVFVGGGPFELEFWPGPPGTGTVRVLVSGHDLNICILPNNLNTCPNIMDFTGAILFKGPPRAVSVVSYTNDNPSGSVSGSYTTTVNPILFYELDYTVAFDTPITSGPIDFVILQIPSNLGLATFTHPIDITGTEDIDDDGDADDSVTVVGVLNLALDPLELHYAWRYEAIGAFGVAGGSATVQVDLDSDGTVDATIECTDFIATDPVNVQTYHNPDTGRVSIVASGTVTATCTATDVDADGDGNDDDTVTITIDIGFILAYNTGLGGGWPPSTLTFVSGSISSSQSLGIDIDSNGVDFTFTNTVNVPGPSSIILGLDPAGRVDRYENTVNSLSCTLTGVIPPSGTAPGTATCTGTVTFTINIYNDGTPEVTVPFATLSGTAPLMITNLAGTVTITGTVTIIAGPTTGDFDNGGPLPPPPVGDTARVIKTISINIVGTLDTAVPELDVTSGGLSMVFPSGDVIDINSMDDPPFDIFVPEFASVDLAGQSISLTAVTGAGGTVPGIITNGVVASNSITFVDYEGVEQVFSYGTLTITADTQADDLPVSTSTITVQFQALGSISHGDRYEATGTAFVSGTGVSLPGVSGTISASGTIELYCLGVGGPFVICSATVTFDGFSGSGLPVSGTLVINSFTSNRIYSGTDFFWFTENEELYAIPLILRGGVSSVGPIARAKLVFANFAFGSHTYGIVTLNPMTLTSQGMGIRFYTTGDSFADLDIETGELVYFLSATGISVSAGSLTLIDPITMASTTYTAPATVPIAFGTKLIIGAVSDPDDVTFTTGGTLAILNGDASAPISANQFIFVQSFVVPLPDMSTDDRHLDDTLFGGYDDFALTGTGMVYITAWVHDIAFKVVDNMGNVLPASNTAVTLTRMNGDPITRGSGSNPDQFQSNLAWSYSQWAGAETGYAIFYQLPGDLAYGVKVTLDGVVVYEEVAEIPKLTQTELITIVANVFKLKVLLLDCNGNTLGPAYLSYIDPNGARRITLVDDFGARDFGFVAGGGFQFTGVWWKGVWVKFVKAKVGDAELPLEPDGTLKITVESNVDSPVKLYANIIDIKFTTYDFNGEHIIPRLNVTLTWVGEHPLTGRKLWFLETFDPTGDTDPTPFNATVTVDQFLKYTVKYFQGKPSESDGLKTYAKAEYVFYQMPPTYYNITVTTVTDSRYDPDEEQTPGSALWPGRTVRVPYEIKILFSSTSAPPRIITSPPETINDRVVLRIFSTFNPDRQKFGRPVTDEWPFEGALKVYNPGGVGDFTGITECAVSRNLYVWAHTFSKRIVDGAGQMRIGGATYTIINDNGQPMQFYHPKDKQFYSTHYSFWTEDTLDTTWLNADFQRLSVIWWNGSYRAEGLVLPTNMSFTVDKWWNESARPNNVWPRHNFTVQPSEAHLKTMSPSIVNKWKSISDTVAPYGNAIVFEKETLLLPAPVTFVKPKAVDKGGEPLERALIEAWILDLDLNSRLRIDTANTGSGYAGDLHVTWTWEMKRVADPDAPQRFRLVRWDRVYLTLTAPAPPPPSGEPFDYNAGDAFADDPGDPLDIVIDAGDIIHFTSSASIFIAAGETLTLRFHTSGTVTITTLTSTVITVNPGDIITFSGGFFGAFITIPPSMIVTVVDVSDPDDTVFTTPGTLEFLPSIAPPAPESKTILVQVPPYPAKLYLRDVIGDFDIVVTARDVTVLVDDPTERDHNVGVDTPMGTPDGLLKYARWYTRSDGLIKSFTIPGYEGLLLLPTSGWLNETFHDGDATTKDEFHYQFNVVWKSAVVYSDNFLLDKKLVEFGASEVYDVRFMFTLSNSTRPEDAVRNLNLWIYYPNVSTWWEQDLWHTVPPSPQDYEACEDSVFPCEKRVTLISSADADGIVEFSKIPGPRFMNTTWKYVFSANHSDVTWLKDLVATQFVLNNETFGDGPLKTVTTSRITVPIMLNAARQLSVVLLTWRDEQGVPTAYPVQGYTVKLQARRLTTTVDTGVLTGVSDALGFVTFNSDPTDVRKIFWAGLTIRYRVEPPAYVNEPDDPKWRDWMKGLNVQLVEQAYNTPTRRSSFAYFPDEEPTHWAINTTFTAFTTDGYCIGLCTYFDKDQGRTISKPFVITVNYAAVTVRAIDFNGRPLAGAFVELVDRASGRIAAWSYVANITWNAKPIDLQELFMFHRGKMLDPRPIGGAGYTAIMNLTFGKWNYDANNDDTVDASGVRDPLRMIIRVYWLSNDPTPTNAVGNLLPVWPFRDETAPLPRHVKVYDSDFDETDNAAKTLEVPHSEAAFGIRLPDRTISASDPVSRGVHRDVTTAVFDFKALLNYAGKTLPDEILRRLEVFVYKKVGATTELSLRFTEGVGMTKGTFTINRLPRGVYEIEVRFGPAGTIFKRTFDISTVNVGTVQVEASLPFTDLSFEVTDLKGRPLTIAPGDVTIEPAAYYFRREVAGNVITVTALYTGAPVTITVKYTSPTYGTSVSVTLTDTADGIKTRLIGGRTLQLPVDDVVISAVDAQGRPVGGAVVTFKGVTKTTGSDGKAIFERVPLGTEDAPITYTVRVSVEGVEVYSKDEPISVARKEISVLAQLFALTVRVVGELGQGLQGASVQLLRAGTTVATGSADAAGAVRFERLAPASYEVRAFYKGFSGSATVSLDMLRRGEVVEIRLPVYVEVLGIPMSLATLIALAIGIILLVIVLAIIISEYRWWRGRRLGVYAPPPPKAPAK